MAFARRLQIDPAASVVTGQTYQTIGAATAYATGTGGASATVPWDLECASAEYTEDVTIAPGICLIGRVPFRTTINGKVDLYPYGGFDGFNVESAGDYALRYHQDSSNAKARGWVSNCRLRVNKSQLGTTSAVELTGAQPVGLLHMQGCYLYASNAYTGSNPTDVAQAVGVRLKSDYVVYAELYGCHVKTSTGSAGTARPILVLNEAVAPSTVWGYVHFIASDWEDVHGDNGVTPHPMYLKSANTVHEGAILDVGFLNVYSTEMPTIQMAYTGTFKLSILYSRNLNQARAIGSIHRNEAGVDYPVTPVIAETRVPAITDVAPEGTLWVRS